MRSAVQFLTGFFLHLYICTAASIPTSATSIADLSQRTASNLTNLPDLPNGDFAVTATWFSRSLPVTACEMVCVTAMRELALYHFDEGVIPPRSWVHPDFPQVRLSVEPARGKEETSVRFTMWIITASLRVMLEDNRFQSVQYVGLYQDQPIGIVRLFNTDNLHAQRNSSFQQQRSSRLATAASDSARASFKFDLTTFGAAVPANDDLQAEVQYLSKSIDRRDLFMSLVWLLLRLAPHNREPLAVWQETHKAITCGVTTIWNRVEQTRYEMTKGDMISFLAYLPEILLKWNKFSEMNIAIKDNGIVVARGLFRTKAFDRLSGLTPTPNVTVS